MTIIASVPNFPGVARRAQRLLAMIMLEGPEDAGPAPEPREASARNPESPGRAGLSHADQDHPEKDTRNYGTERELKRA